MDVSRASIFVLILASQALFTATDVNVNTTTPCEEGLSVEIVNGHVLANGSILAPNGLVYAPEQFWVDGTDPGLVRGCVCQLKKCLRKCCPDNHVFHAEVKGSCTPKNHSLLIDFPPIETDVGDQEDVHVIFGDVCAWGKYKADPVPVYEFDSDGKLMAFDGDTQMNLTADEYCLEVVFDDGASEVTLFPCYPEPVEEEPVNHATLVLYSLGMLVSEPFLLATFLVYGIIPELRNIHGKNLMSHVTSLFTAYLFLSIVQLGGKAIPSGFCVTSAFIVYFSFLASFFWLNIMCFDLWWTFSGFKPLRGSVRERDHKKFIFYSLYCWGAPFIMLVVVMSMHFVGDDVNAPDNRYIFPGFGVNNCWFHDTEALWAYFYGPVAVILTVNLTMFITTAFKIVQLKKETAMLKGSESKRHDDEDNKQQFSLYLKLFIVMGVNWAMEVLSAAIGGSEYIWIITDICNSLQGVLIFIIFVWKDKVRKLIRRRFGDSSDSRSMANSCSKSTRVFSSTGSSVRNTSMSTTEFSMVPMTNKEP